MTISVTVAILSIIVTVFVSSGALAFFINFGTRMALSEASASRHEQALKEALASVSEMRGRVSTLEDMMQSIRAQLVKLDQIPLLTANMEGLRVRIDERLSQMVPRGEHEAHWRAQEQRFDELRREISEKT